MTPSPFPADHDPAGGIDVGLDGCGGRAAHLRSGYLPRPGRTLPAVVGLVVLGSLIVGAVVTGFVLYAVLAVLVGTGLALDLIPRRSRDLRPPRRGARRPEA